jgi:ABC-type multidrug transport system permease subunit
MNTQTEEKTVTPEVITMTKIIVPIKLTQTPSSSRQYSFIAFVVTVMLLTSCAATQPPLSPDGDVPGFWLGLWHGFIAPITFIISLFQGLRIYAFPNAGLWYDFGFMLGISGFSGGVFAGSRRKRERN